MRLAPLAFALLATLAAAAASAQSSAQASTPASAPISLTQAMADPDWIGPPVEGGW